MSNRRKLRGQAAITAAIVAADGAIIPGGCDYCDAYQEIRAQWGDPNVHLITLKHDDWCPWLTRTLEASTR